MGLPNLEFPTSISENLNSLFFVIVAIAVLVILL